MYARLGIPQKVISDNGPQYSSQEFVTFATKYDFMHASSSPRHPQSNGLAEKTVQIAKRIFDKSESDGRTCNLTLAYLNTVPPFLTLGILLQNYYKVTSCAQYCPLLLTNL